MGSLLVRLKYDLVRIDESQLLLGYLLYILLRLDIKPLLFELLGTILFLLQFLLQNVQAARIRRALLFKGRNFEVDDDRHADDNNRYRDHRKYPLISV